MCAGFINQQDQQNVLIHPVRPPGELQALQVLDNIAAEMENIDHLRQRTIREMEKALRKQEELELDKVEETLTLVAMAAVHPITVARALIQFGYEPFPTTVGPRYVLFGQPVVFLPNLFSYMRQLTKENKLSTLFEGLDSAICIHIVGGTVDGIVWKMLGYFFQKRSSDVRRKHTLSSTFKFSSRLLLTDIAVKIVTRPFKVVMFRQIACIIGNEPVFSTMKGLESGLKAGWTDLFSGLGTELRNVIIGSMLAFLCRHIINRTFFHHYEKNEKKIVTNELLECAYEVFVTAVTRFTELGLSVLFQCTIGCPLEVASKVRAIAGTGITAAKNYPAECKTHHGTMNYLTVQSAVLNGLSWFFRIKPPGPGLLPELSFQNHV